MTSRLTVEDLQLVEATARQGSLGAAAKELLVAQPSASRRLGALERRLGTTLFERDTTGARATAAGRELARHAARILADLEALPDHVLAAVDSPVLAVGTIQALSSMVFTALEIELDGIIIQPEVDHGPVLLQLVHEGALDAAVVTIGEQTVTPRGLQRSTIGISPLVVVLPDGADGLSTKRRPFTGRPVLYNTIDLAGRAVHQRLSDLGAAPRPAATAETALRVARHLRCPALVPDLAAHWYAVPGDRIIPSPLSGQVNVSLFSRPPQLSTLTRVLPRIAERILGARPDALG